MQNLNCLNLQAQSGVAASVAIAVAAATSEVAALTPSPRRIRPRLCGASRFSEEVRFSGSLPGHTGGLQCPETGRLRHPSWIRTHRVHHVRDGHLRLQKSPRRVGATDWPLSRAKVSGTRCSSPRIRCLRFSGATLGIPSVAVTEEGWLDPGVTLPLPDDDIYCTQAAKPDSRLLALADGREVILDTSFGHSPQIGHSLQYHCDCQVFVWQPAPEDALTPALLIVADEQSLELAKAPLRRRFVSYPYEDNAGETLSYHYPLVYRASDDFIPCIEKDEMKRVTGKDGKEEWVKKRVPMKGVPNCRIRRTMIVTQTDAGIISLDRNAGSSTVIEEMEGVTSTRREVTFHQQPSDYTADAYIAKDFTNTSTTKLPEFRSFLAAQKGQRGHPIAFGTHSKGYFGLRHPVGETVYPRWLHRGRSGAVIARSSRQQPANHRPAWCQGRRVEPQRHPRGMAQDHAHPAQELERGRLDGLRCVDPHSPFCSRR